MYCTYSADNSCVNNTAQAALLQQEQRQACMSMDATRNIAQNCTRSYKLLQILHSVHKWEFFQICLTHIFFTQVTSSAVSYRGIREIICLFKTKLNADQTHYVHGKSKLGHVVTSRSIHTDMIMTSNSSMLQPLFIYLLFYHHYVGWNCTKSALLVRCVQSIRMTSKKFYKNRQNAYNVAQFFLFRIRSMTEFYLYLDAWIRFETGIFWQGRRNLSDCCKNNLIRDFFFLEYSSGKNCNDCCWRVDTIWVVPMMCVLFGHLRSARTPYYKVAADWLFILHTWCCQASKQLLTWWADLWHGERTSVLS
jgi:hypothetical protein